MPATCYCLHSIKKVTLFPPTGSFKMHHPFFMECPYSDSLSFKMQSFLCQAFCVGHESCVPSRILSSTPFFLMQLYTFWIMSSPPSLASLWDPWAGWSLNWSSELVLPSCITCWAPPLSHFWDWDWKVQLFGYVIQVLDQVLRGWAVRLKYRRINSLWGDPALAEASDWREEQGQ